MKWQVPIVFFVLFLLFTTFAPQVLAVSVVASQLNPPSFINNESRTVQVTVTTTSTGPAYLKAAFYAVGTSNYFGCTQGLNVASPACGTDPTTYPLINGSGTYSIVVSPDLTSAFYVPNGDFKFVVFRCTASGCTLDNVSTPQDVHMTNTITPSPTPTPLPTAVSTPTPTPTATPIPTPVLQPTNIQLSEFVACPSSGGSEWVEIFNNNDGAMTLDSWILRDATTSNKQVFSVTMAAKSYASINIANPMYNNSGDTVRLDDANDSLLDSYTYTTCDPNQSWSRLSSGGWQQTPLITQGSANQFPVVTVTPTPSSTPTPTVTPKPTVTPTPTLDPSAEGSDVLGLSTVNSTPNDPAPTPRPTPFISTASASLKRTPPWSAFAAIGLGTTSVMGLGGYLWYDRWKGTRSSI